MLSEYQKTEWIKKRKEKRLSQNDVALLIGVSGSSYNKYENGYQVPPPDVAARIAKVLELPVSAVKA
ncbi:MAG: helix-turn-helix transcriptional regulator [Clostridia bacterium]|nr:helix-turn-helix transcriptional regulator [Clostridia bacterium]